VLRVPLYHHGFCRGEIISGGRRRNILCKEVLDDGRTGVFLCEPGDHRACSTGSYHDFRYTGKADDDNEEGGWRRNGRMYRLIDIVLKISLLRFTSQYVEKEKDYNKLTREAAKGAQHHRGRTKS
jgi:hypothetical protein